MEKLLKNLLNDKRDFDAFCKDNGFTPINPKMAFRKFQDLKDKEIREARLAKNPRFSSKEICRSYLKNLKHWGTWNGNKIAVFYNSECGSEILQLENVKLK